MTDPNMRHDPDTHGLPATDADPVVPRLLQAVLPVWVHQIELAIDLSQRTVHQLIQSFGAINAELQGRGITSVSAELEKIYVGLQYHDRLSQLLRLVTTDAEGLLQALSETGAADAANLDPMAWLSRLESRFAMAEQSGNPAAAGSGQADSGIEHF